MAVVTWQVTSDRPGAEADLFWRNRTDVTSARKQKQFEAHIPGVPGNYFLARGE